MDNNFLNFISNLVKPRDFIFSVITSIPTFLVESYDETYIDFLTAGESSIVAAVLGLTLSKINDLTFIKFLEKRKPLQKYKSLLSRFEKEASNPKNSNKKQKSLDKLIEDTKTTLELYDEKIFNIEDLENRFKKLVERYEND